MKLLHTEIDVVPGRKPQKQPLPEGFVGAGTAVLRVDNTTSRQNSYTVRIRCEEPYWQDAWFQVMALPPTGGPENQPPPGKPDQPGPRNQSITIFVKDGGTRDVFLSFFVPEKSECRSGAYKITLLVETRIVSDDPQVARKERVTEIPATVIVRPFYKWAISYAPEDQKVGFFKRGKQYEVVIENQGNDWLYCDLKMPRPQSVLIDAPSVRIAVPPPEPSTESVRTVPFKAISRIKAVRGEHQHLPLPITVQRVFAPTVPPLPEDAQFGPSGANTGAAVVAAETQDVGTPENPATLTYCPLIPATLTGFFQALIRNAKGLFMMVIGLVIAYNLAVFSWKYFFTETKLVNLSTTQVQLNKPFTITGHGLIGAKVYVYDLTGKQQIAEAKAVPTMDSASEQKLKVTISDPAANDKKVRIGVQRGGMATLLDRFLPVELAMEEVEIGTPPVQHGAAAGTTSPTVEPGQPLVIGGTNFGTAKGRVLLNGEAAPVTGWNDTQITVRIPQKLQDGNPITLQVIDSNGNSIAVNPSTIAVMSAMPPPGADTAGGPGPGGQTAGGQPGGGTGGTTGGPATGTTGSAGGGTNGGTTNPNTGAGPGPAVLAAPPGYKFLLADSRSGYVSAVENATGGSAGALAVKAYALASLGGGKVDDAKQALLKAGEARGSGGAAEAMYYLALARVTEKLNPSKANDAYMLADDKANKAAPAWAFVDIAIARYKISSGSWGEADALLKDASTRNPSPEEAAAIQKMAQQVANKQQ